MKSFIIFFLLPVLTHGQNVTELNKDLENNIDSIMNQYFKKDAPGAALLVAKDGKILYKKAFGKADLELDVPMKSEMIFEIGSITKQFTAIAILKLLEQGKLTLEDDIRKYIPEYPSHEHNITIHHLLNQTSGIKELLSIEDKNNLPSISYKPLELISIFKDQPLDFVPGSKWSYSNSNYSILGYIIEIASGMSYSKFMEENIFKPAGMFNSMDGSNEKIIKNRVRGYYRSRSGTFYNANFLHLSYPYASGSILSSAEDMFKWQQALNANTLIKQTTKGKPLLIIRSQEKNRTMAMDGHSMK
ncbi:MAG: serine hydrolase domain-containing protein [Chitinophagaceae bacterium]